MACVSSQKSSFQHLYDAPLQRRISPIDDNITSHVCGFCATSLGVWSSSWLAHQATRQSFLAGTSGATQNHAQVGPLSCCYHCWDRHLHPMVMLMGNPRMMSFPLNWLTTKCVFLLELAILLWLNFFGQSGSVSKFPPFLCVKLWVGWVGRGYIEISRYFPALWINRVTLVTKIKLWYSLGC